MGGKAGISSWYFDDKSEKEESYKSRGRDEIEELVSVGLRREEYYYGATDNYLHEAFDSFGIEGLEVLIIGIIGWQITWMGTRWEYNGRRAVFVSPFCNPTTESKFSSP